MFRFEEWNVWQKAIDFADGVYDVSDAFPTEERFGLTSQVRRASVSISTNIAEGSGRVSGDDFARFVEIAYGSTMEVVSHTVIAKRRRWIEEAAYKQTYHRADELARMLSGLRSSLKSK